MLIASALLSLSVMSAFVAFNGFPGQSVQAPIGSLLLGEQHPPTVTVPTKPLRSHGSAASGRSTSRAGAHRGVTHARAVSSPVAHTGPVVDRVPAGQPAQPQAPASSAPAQPQQSTAVGTPGTVSNPLPTGTAPSLPDTGLPALPQVTLPPLSSPSSPPPTSSQLPVDTSGATGVLGGQ
jgi:hypothetical protein